MSGLLQCSRKQAATWGNGRWQLRACGRWFVRSDPSGKECALRKVRLVSARCYFFAMKDDRLSEPRLVTVREMPIELCQFIKFAGLAESGGAAKQLVAEGGVLVNGEKELRKRRKLAAGDKVTIEGRTIVVHLG